MKMLLFGLLSFFIAPAIAHAGLVGSLTGLDPSTYNDQWRVPASTSYLILDYISGGDDLTYNEMVGFGSDSNGDYCDIHIGDSPGVTERVYLGDVHDIGGVYVGAVSISSSNTRCLWAYNFNDLSFLGETTPSTPTIEPVQDICGETDAGHSPYATGTMTHNFLNLSSPATDFCINDSQVNEYYCDSNLLDGSHSDTFDCPYGCLDGRCLYDYEVEPEEICEETDEGYAPYAVGTITHNFQNFGSPSTDFCVNENQVNEYYCNSDLLDGSHTSVTSCEHGCLNGRCLYDYEVEEEEEDQPPPPPPQEEPEEEPEEEQESEEAESTPLKQLIIRFAELIQAPFDWLWNLFN